MINNNLKEGVLKLKRMWVEVYKDIFRNRKGFCLNWIRMFFEVYKIVV